ncbi:expressed unknown protein [Seminavis robusta]|uniref:Uncharacterized protein n=1 Tax=Seminavis robusta TaxID=568900 RepID=A0A9N8HNV5_9STRA|nr:expressed unknown protein [Seminavis robusta]|eukprot:Sro1028_g233130.1 n/a (208) ;mRNA; f:8706-9440
MEERTSPSVESVVAASTPEIKDTNNNEAAKGASSDIAVAKVEVNTVDSPNSTTTSNTNTKCSKCAKRAARRGCTQHACLNCCDDNGCATHLEVREQAQWREQVLAGTTPLQVRAEELRNKAIPPGRFKESGFSYLGDSVVLWDLQQYLTNPTWKEEAVRKSNKRKTRQRNNDLATAAAVIPNGHRKKNRRQRFQDVMDGLYQKSLSS